MMIVLSIVIILIALLALGYYYRKEIEKYLITSGLKQKIMKHKKGLAIFIAATTASGSLVGIMPEEGEVTDIEVDDISISKLGDIEVKESKDSIAYDMKDDMEFSLSKGNNKEMKMQNEGDVSISIGFQNTGSTLSIDEHTMMSKDSNEVEYIWEVSEHNKDSMFSINPSMEFSIKVPNRVVAQYTYSFPLELDGMYYVNGDDCVFLFDEDSDELLYEINRPIAWDSDDWEVNVSMKVKEGNLILTVPEIFINNATYPILIDPEVEFTEYTIDASLDGTRGVFAIDVDSDNDIDVVATGDTADDVVWYENDGSESFTKHTIDASLDGALGVFAIDVDSDNDIDVVVVGFGADDVVWYENDGSENFTKHTIDASLDGAGGVFAIDVNDDTYIDVIAVASAADDVVWYENDGSESFTKHTIDASLNGARSIFAIDVDSDNDIDVIATGDVADDVVWYKGKVNATNISQIEGRGGTDVISYMDTSYHPTTFNITYNSTDINYIRINVSDIDSTITSDMVSLAFNSSLYTANPATFYPSGDSGGYTIILDETTWTEANGCTGDSPFPITTNIYISFAIKVEIPLGASTGWHNNTAMTYDYGS